MRSRISHRVIISAFKSDLDRGTNINRTVLLENMLKKMQLDYHRVLGKYKGEEEISLMIYSPPTNTLMQMAKILKQESILEVSSEGAGWLLFTEDDSELYIGDMKVHREEPDGDYSYVFDLGVFFTFENRFNVQGINKETQSA